MSCNIVTALAVQRYIYVCHAPMAKQWCTVSRSWLMVTIIILGASLQVTIASDWSITLSSDWLQMLPRVLDRVYEVTTAGKPITLTLSKHYEDLCATQKESLQ